MGFWSALTRDFSFGILSRINQCHTIRKKGNENVYAVRLSDIKWVSKSEQIELIIHFDDIDAYNNKINGNTQGRMLR